MIREYAHPLDINGNFHLLLRVTPASKTFHAHILSYPGSNHILERHLLPMLSLTLDGEKIPGGADGTFTAPLKSNVFVPLTVSLNAVAVASFQINRDEISLSQVVPTRPLSVFETRMIGRAPNANVPYPAARLDRLPFPITDLHTHLSAQVSSRDLIDIALEKNTLYPITALEMLGIPYTPDAIQHIPRRIFLPLAHLQQGSGSTEPAVPMRTLLDNGLYGERLQRLEKALGLSPETQRTYEDLEIRYYLREPFTKNILVLPAILRRVAEDYAKQGVRYAELSSNAVLDPAWLRTIHEVMPAIERDTGVQLRFLAGLPRNLSEEALSQRMETIQHLADSPYVVGVDLLGYEMNRTTDLSTTLRALADWAKTHHPDFILRIHAGENGKNPDNMKEALRIGLEYGVRIRIGHAVYGVDDETLSLATQLAGRGLLVVEFNPDSNLALNNIDFPHDLPMLQFLQLGIPSVLGSDGGGIYQTTSQQLAMAALFSGVTPLGFSFIRQGEQAHIDRQEHIFEQQERALPSDFFEKLEALVHNQSILPRHGADKKALQAMRPVKEFIEGKIPLLIGGAAGSSWDTIDPSQQLEIATGLELLVRYLNPTHSCFITGRTKDRGIGVELGRAVAQHNRTPKASHFLLMAVMAEGQQQELSPLPGFSQIEMLDTPLVYLPSTMIKTLQDNNGVALFIGGRAFTRDFILKSEEHGLPYGLMNGPAGASTDKAEIYPSHSFEGAQGMIAYLHHLRPELFTPGFSLATLPQDYASVKAVLSNGFSASLEPVTR